MGRASGVPHSKAKHTPTDRQVQSLLAALKLQSKDVKSAVVAYLGYPTLSVTAREYLEQMEAQGLIWLERGPAKNGSGVDVPRTVHLKKPEPKKPPRVPELSISSGSRVRVRYDECPVDLDALPINAQKRLEGFSEYLIRSVAAMFALNGIMSSVQITNQIGDRYDWDSLWKAIEVMADIGMIRLVSKNPSTYQWVWRSVVKERSA